MSNGHGRRGASGVHCARRTTLNAFHCFSPLIRGWHCVAAHGRLVMRDGQERLSHAADAANAAARILRRDATVASTEDCCPFLVQLRNRKLYSVQKARRTERARGSAEHASETAACGAPRLEEQVSEPSPPAAEALAVSCSFVEVGVMFCLCFASSHPRNEPPSSRRGSLLDLFRSAGQRRCCFLMAPVANL